MKSVISNESQVNVVIDPGHSWLKVADEDFNQVYYASVVAAWGKDTPGLLCPNTVKITVLNSTLPAIHDKCYLVGEKAKMSQSAEKLYGNILAKSHELVAPLFAITSLSSKIPAKAKEVTIKDSHLVALLFNKFEMQDYVKAVAGQTTVVVERMINGIKDTVKLNIDWEPQNIHCLQEGTQALEFARYNKLGLDQFNANQLLGSISVGCKTIEAIIQAGDGTILQEDSFPLGSSTLAKAIQPVLTSKMGKMGKSANISIDQILEAFKKGHALNKYTYGVGSQQVSYEEEFLAARSNWKMNVMGNILDAWAEKIPHVEKIFLHGGSAPLLEIDQEQFFSFDSKDSQFVDVWGALLWAKQNLFTP